jgi:hypothetical protein
MGRITGIGIPAAGSNIGLITVVFRLVRRAHLSPKEHRNSDQERTADDQRWRQRRQIREHGGHLLELAFVPMSLLLAL